MAKNIGFGSSLSTSTGVIAQVVSISHGGLATNDVEVTTLDSTNNYRSFLPGILDSGEVTLELVYDKVSASHVALHRYWSQRTTLTGLALHITGSSSDSDAFSGYVKGIDRTIPLDDRISATVTLKVTGTAGLTT